MSGNVNLPFPVRRGLWFIVFDLIPLQDQYSPEPPKRSGIISRSADAKRHVVLHFLECPLWCDYLIHSHAHNAIAETAACSA